ncbi:DUF2321 domain-containing protein [Myxococcus virescens]|uniref:DUF2321 domain-containing protein n=1 Tax=Myxococcus virescens TaxID=83456 RepID=UPI003DA2C7E5
MFFAGNSDDGHSGYDVAQICERGHVINSSSVRSPQFNKKFCTKCGAATRTTCAQCNAPIQGEYHSAGVIHVGFKMNAPAHCHQCGAQHPWTIANIKAAQDLVDMSDAPDAEKTALKTSAPDLLVDSPQSQVAASRWKKFFAGTGKQVADVGRQLLVDVASEAVKKVIWP